MQNDHPRREFLQRPPRWLIWACLLAIALAARLAAAEVWQARLQRQAGSSDEVVVQFGDSDGYLRLAKRIATGQPFEYGWEHAAVFRTPGYPLLLAGVIKLTEETRPVRAARWLGALLGTVVVALAARIGTRLGGRAVGYWTALLVGLNPAAIFLSILILAETPFCLFLLLALEGLFRWCQRWQPVPLAEIEHHVAGLEDQPPGRAITSSADSWWGAILFGLSSGLATLVRPSWLLFVPAVLLLVGLSVLFRPSHRRRRFWQACTVALLFVLPLTPWMLRNWDRVGVPVPTTLQTGSSLYDGWHAEATGRSDMSFVAAERLAYLQVMRKQVGLRPEERLAAWQQTPADIERAGSQEAYWALIRGQVAEIENERPEWSFEVGFDRYLRNQALAWAGRHPEQVAWLALQKIVHLWSPWPRAEQLGGTLPRLVLAISYLGLLGLAAVGAWRWRKAALTLVLLLAPAVYFTALHAVFVSSLRYREPPMLPLAVLAAVGLQFLLRGWRRRAAT